jgi:hypothetical protein
MTTEEFEAKVKAATSEAEVIEIYLDAGHQFVTCAECFAVVALPGLLSEPLCGTCGRPLRFIEPVGPPKPLVPCTCGRNISSYAKKCPHQHLHIGDDRDEEATEAVPTVRTRAEYIPAGSVGACPACGSRNTGDFIEEERAKSGFFAAKGMQIGIKVAGRGRFHCKNCGHNWEFNLP